ncbi:MAG TPA: YgcG family protein [Burkholderiales bacterium]|nr:YgcG family protein [Burkholderiales bacterium]
MSQALPRALLAAALLLPPAYAAAEIAVPPLRARVTDLSATLTSDQRAALEQKLAALEARKGSQVAVLLVPTTQPEAVEQYAIRVFDQWKLGRKGVDDGVLLLVAKNDRRLRIEVGYGLEGAIPDAVARRVIEEDIVPLFKQGNFYGGISAGTDRVIKLIEGESMPPPRRTAAPGSGWSAETLFIGFIILAMVSQLLHSLLGRFLGAGVAGTAAGIVGYVLAGLAAAVIIGLIAFVISLFIGATGRQGRGWSSGGNWSSGGGSWSSGGGGSSGGGFGGGGGGSGGGGASGSW